MIDDIDEERKKRYEAEMSRDNWKTVSTILAAVLGMVLLALKGCGGGTSY